MTRAFIFAFAALLCTATLWAILLCAAILWPNHERDPEQEPTIMVAVPYGLDRRPVAVKVCIVGDGNECVPGCWVTRVMRPGSRVANVALPPCYREGGEQ